MVSMRERVQQYLAHRRACGYRLRTEGYLLDSFARFADRTAAGKPLTTVLALQWASQPRTQLPVSRANRIDAIRPFARFCRVFDPRTEIPPTHLSRANRRRVPYILTEIGRAHV